MKAIQTYIRTLLVLLVLLLAGQNAWALHTGEVEFKGGYQQSGYKYYCTLIIVNGQNQIVILKNIERDSRSITFNDYKVSLGLIDLYLNGTFVLQEADSNHLTYITTGEDSPSITFRSMNNHPAWFYNDAEAYQDDNRL